MGDTFSRPGSNFNSYVIFLILHYAGRLGCVVCEFIRYYGRVASLSGWKGFLTPDEDRQEELSDWPAHRNPVPRAWEQLDSQVLRKSLQYLQKEVNLIPQLWLMSSPGVGPWTSAKQTKDR